MSRKSTEERRAEIVEALLRVMADQGYAKATIQKIADEAGLTAGLIHYHFKSKQEILLALLERLARQQQERNQRILGEATSPKDRVRAAILSFLRVGGDSDREAVASWVTITAEAIRQPEVREAYAASIERLKADLVDAIEAGIATGDFVTGELSADGCAAGIIACLQGYYNMGVAARNSVPRGSAAPAVLRMASGLLGVTDTTFTIIPE